MKRLVFILACHLALGGLWAQTDLNRITISASDTRVRFWVDGAAYIGTATFQWPPNSRHTVSFEVFRDGYQYDPLGMIRFTLNGWEDSTGTLAFGSGPTQVVYAAPEVAWIRINVSVEFLVRLQFWDLGDGQAPQCDGGGGAFGPGVVFVNGTCFRASARLWLPAEVYTLEARPLPGFVFTGWNINSTNPQTYVQTVQLTGPAGWTARFNSGKRVRFLTEPLGLKVLVDYGLMATPAELPCSWEQTPPLEAQGVGSLCIGEVDWAIGSRHVIGAPSPQKDPDGRDWVFDGFSNGLGNQSAYEAKSVGPETITARFVRGARIALLTDPPGLRLTVNGRDDLPSYFVAKTGETLTVSAPAEQIGPTGRSYAFRGWSNGGDATQEVTVPVEAVDKGLWLTARYEMLSRVLVSSEPGGVPVEVDGAACETPCAIDRDEGTEVALAAPESHGVSPGYRVGFASWSDGGPRTRTVKVANSERAHFTARYKNSYLLETSSDPPAGAEFIVEPPSPDGFYSAGTPVRVTAQENRGYRFRHWAGDLGGASLTGWLTMEGPRSVTALLDEVPYLDPAGVRNAAGPTPVEEVAAGSIISIYGGMLAPHLEVGPQNPLVQTLAGVAVRVDDRILALLLVSPEQINAVLPPDLPEGIHSVVISRPGQPDMEGEVTTVRNAPGLFTRPVGDEPFVMASHEDGSPVTLEQPASRGEIIDIYGTGFGPYDKVPPYGFALPATPKFVLVDPVEVMAGDLPLQPEWAGGAPGLTGADLMRLRIPEELAAPATVELKVRINGRESNTVLLPVE